MAERHDLVYVIGVPGVGKTTAVANLVGTTGWAEVAVPIPHLRKGDVVMPGRKRHPFGGTDTLAMNIARPAEAWIASRPARLVIGEGDRLAYGRFFDVAASAGYDVHVVVLWASEAIIDSRRQLRVAQFGAKPQNPTWLKGRVAKVSNLIAAYEPHLIDADLRSPVEVADQMRSLLDRLGLRLNGHEG